MTIIRADRSYPSYSAPSAGAPADKDREDAKKIGEATVILRGRSYKFDIIRDESGSCFLRYVVRRGDSLSKISQATKEAVSQLSGVSLSQENASKIARANRIRNSNIILIDQIIDIGISDVKEASAAPQENTEGQTEAAAALGYVNPVVDQTDYLALSFISEVSGGKPGAEKAVLIWNTVKEFSSKYGVDPLLVLCLIARESNFKQFARSKEGCLGLMQILPSTGAMLGLKKCELTDIRKSIDAGVRYLAEDCQIREKGLLGLAGYNAGPKRADLSIACGFSRKFRRNLRVNPETYDQTKHYIYCIYNSYQALKKGDLEAATRYSMGEYSGEELLAFTEAVRAGQIQLDPPTYKAPASDSYPA